MKKLLLNIAIGGLAFAGICMAEEFKIPDLEKLAQHAKETVDVTLDQSMLQLASGFLSKDDPDQVQVKQLVSKLKGIYVRSYEFAKEGEYSQSDADAVRSQLKQPGWSRIVGVKSVDGEKTEIYVQKVGDHFGGLVVLALEPKEFTVVHIDGPINPEDINKLSGHLGIPDITKSKSDKSQKKED